MATVKKEMDMLNGPMWKNILIFTIPIALTATMQNLFHSADLAVVGRFCGKTELAAVGSNGSIITLLVNVFSIFSVGSNVIIGQFLGAHKLKEAKKAVYSSLSIAIIAGILVSFLGIIFSPLLLRLISSPPDVINLATTYLRIYFLGIPFLMVYNFSAAILRSRGETTKPFFCLLTSGIVNVVLNVIFVVVFKAGVAGVGIATTVSNVISCFMILTFLTKDKGPLGINLKEIKPDKFIMLSIIKIGLPMSVQSFLFPLSNMMVQSAVNSFGTSVIAGNAAACSIEAFIYTFESGFSSAVISFVSQNFGAGNIKRCRRAFKESLGLGLLVCSLFNLLLYLFMDFIISMFTTDPKVAELVSYRLVFMFLTFPLVIYMDLLTQAIRGMGQTVVPTIVSLVGICGLRILWLSTVFKVMNSYLSILLTYPVSWGLVGIILGICYLVITKKEEKKLLNQT